MADGSYFIFSQCIFFTTTAAAAAGAEKASKRAEMSHLALKGQLKFLIHSSQKQNSRWLQEKYPDRRMKCRVCLVLPRFLKLGSHASLWLCLLKPPIQQYIVVMAVNLIFTKSGNLSCQTTIFWERRLDWEDAIMQSCLLSIPDAKKDCCIRQGHCHSSSTTTTNAKICKLFQYQKRSKD